MSGLEYLEGWGVQDPDEVGASEYRAIHETIADALDGCDEDVADKPIDFALAMLEEFSGWALDMKAKLEKVKADGGLRPGYIGLG